METGEHELPGQGSSASGPNVKYGTLGSFFDNLDLTGFIRKGFENFTHHDKTGRDVADNTGAIGFMPFGDSTSISTQLKIIAIDTLSRTVCLHVNPALMSKAEPQDVDFVKLLVCDMEKFFFSQT